MDKTYAIPDFLSRHTRRIGSVTLVSALLLVSASAQNVSLYTFSSSGGGTLDPMSSASVLIGSGQDDTPSAVSSIGFAFNYEGTNYSDFSVNSNGGMKLGGAQIGGSAINFNLTSNPLVLLPYTGDGTTANGSVTTTLTGSLPNRIRVVQWNVGMDYNVATANCLYQVWLYEGTNVIEFRYGAGVPTGNFSGGMQVAITGATATNYLNVLSDLTASSSNTALFSTTNAWPGTGTILTFSPPAPCTPPPAPGNTVASISTGCSGFSSTLSLQNSTPGSGVSYQWQSSPNGVDTWTNVGTNNATYTTAALSTTTWFQCLVTCSTGPSTVNSTPVELSVAEPSATYFTYAGTQFTEAFASWGNRCSTGDVPSSVSNHWKNTPTFGPGTWRASNTSQVASGWNNVSGGFFVTTVAPNANAVPVTLPAARFHSRQGSSVVGTLDFHVDMSAGTGSEMIRFEYINSAGSGTMGVWVSTNGGANFTQVGSTLTTTAINTWETKEFTIGSTSATTVIRLRGTAAPSASGNDIGVDNFRIIPAVTCAAPTAPSAAVVGAGAVDISWTCASCTGTYFVEYGASGFTLGTGTVAGPFTNSPASITGLANGNYQAYVRQNCGVAGTSTNAGPMSFSIVAGDFCASAINFAGSNASDTPTTPSGTTANATNTYASTACAPSAPGPDAVLYHDVDAGATLSFTIQNLGGAGMVLRYGGACPGDVQLGCGLSYFTTTPLADMDGQVTWTNPTCTTQRVYLQVEGAGAGGPFYIWNYNYVTGAPPCNEVSNVSSSITSSTTASINWDATCSGNAIVEYGPAGFTPGTGATAGDGTITAINGTSTTLNGLALDQAYEVYVRNDCGAGQYSTNGTPVQFTIINGDDCTRAIDLSTETSPFFGTTNGATNDISVHDCGTFNGGDIILSYPVGVGATISFFAAHDYAATVAVSYGTSCPGSTSLTCENDLAEFTWTNTTGSVQNIYWTQDGVDEGDFSLEWIYQPPCTNELTIELRSDAPAQTTWEILDATTNTVVGSGGPLNGSPETNETCVPDGCYVLRVYDSGGDGMMGGGYILRTSGTNLRIIDNSGNFNSGSVSELAAGSSFCLPLGTDKLIYSSCDKLDWVANKFIVASANALVSAQFGITNSTSGYEFWFFDPNGTYTYRRFRSHATSDGFGTGATRACHFKVNGWTNSVATPHLPNNVLLNVRVRGRVAGNNLEFGPACQFKLDPVLAACPRVKLQDDPVNTSDFSCGVSRNFGGASSPSNRIYAAPPQPIPAVASSAVRYQFRFRIPGENICIVRPPQTSARMVLNWTTGTLLECSKTYEVDVRVSLDGGATWCFGPATADQTAACADTEAWGKVCLVTINPCAEVNGGGSSMVVGGNNTFTMYPNPNRGDQLFIKISRVHEGVKSVNVDIFDLTGKQLTARRLAVQDGVVNSTLELNGELPNGTYLMNITAGSKAFTERLVIQR